MGREGDTEFIVLEYRDGGTLASRLQRGAVPVEEAIEIGIQIADVLDAAPGDRTPRRRGKPPIRGGHGNGQVRDLAWTRPCAGVGADDVGGLIHDAAVAARILRDLHLADAEIHQGPS